MKKIFFVLFALIAVYDSYACTVIVVGKNASTDGSVIISHTDAGPDCRVHYVPPQNYKAGAMADIHFGMVDLGRTIGDYGKVLGQLPQVEHTYGYFQSAYSQINQYQLAIGESTISQREGLKVNPMVCKQIMTIEQAQAFALQRCKTAKEAVTLIASLMEKYGFLTSCVGESESLAIGDVNEVWIMEFYSVGNNWTPESGKPGVIWAAKRVPDDHTLIIPNWSIIKQINIKDTLNYRASSNYMQLAIDSGWYNPNSGLPFIWQDAYSPVPREWATSRFWKFYYDNAPQLGLPNRYTNDPTAGDNQYTQFVEPLSIYPFSVKPAKKISVQDVMAFQRSTFTGTIYDKENAPAWFYPNADGKLVRSPIATPFPTIEMRKVLNINRRRNVARAHGEYGMVAQLRGWLPDEVGGIYWFFLDNAYTSAYVPIYTGATDVAECYKIYDQDNYDENSARWAVDFVDNLLYLRWQDAVKDLHTVRDPLEKSFFDEQAEVDKKAQQLLKKSPKKAKEYLTKLTIERMEKSHKMFLDLRNTLITRYTNNKQGI